MAPGNRMPFCAGMGANRQFYSFDVQAGRAAVLVLGGALPAAITTPVAEALAAHRAELAALDADLLVILGFAAGPGAWQDGPGAAAGVPIVLCQDDFFSQCELPADSPLVVVIDRAARIVGAWAGQDAAALADAALAAARHIAREPARDCVLPAPVLALPGLFDAALCHELIERFESGANFDSGVSGLDADGRPIDRLDPGKKRRRDWMLSPGEAIHTQVTGLLFGRCAAEIKRAFRCEVSHADRVLVARYDDAGGYFRRHRDNMGESVAFRQFAISVNLNSGYDGGHLLFPEYNDHRYRPAAGEAIVFSTSLLHEATPVTRGLRYVLLTFLHDSAAENRRLATSGNRRTLARA